MNKFKEWAGHEYSKRQRAIAVALGGFFFWIVIPCYVVYFSSYLDHWFYLPRFRYGWINPVIGLVFMVVGWLFANWTVKVQFTIGKGTPVPLMATQKLIVRGPYAYCRNPMTLGTAMFYVGIALWIGSISALGLALVYPIGILIYIKLIEESELKSRFGSEYSEYKRRTPFLIPRIIKRR